MPTKPNPHRVALLDKEEESKDLLRKAYEQYLAKLKADKKISDEEEEKRRTQANDTKKPVLVFDSKEAADKFFTDQAKAKVPFTVVMQDGKGQLTGAYKFSDGNGTLYQGQFKPETIAELEKAIAEVRKNPELSAKVDEALKTNDELKLLSALRELKKTTDTATVRPITAAPGLSALPDGPAVPALTDKNDEEEGSGMSPK
jgi:hypothetical protein